MAKARDYKKEYAEYHGKPEQIKERAARVQARRDMVKAGKAKKGDGLDVDHIKPIRSGGGSDLSNLRMMSVKRNRGWRDGR
jgi:hypothetical protein